MLIPADVVAQRRYLKSAQHTHSNGSLGIGPAILRGLRDLGYRDTAAAVCALIDNAIDAQASRVDVVLETGAGVTALAVIDNGLGMVPEMIRAACAVGASCKLGEGPHLARAGFGLPSAPFAIGTRFEIHSKPAGAPLARAVLDLASVETDDAQVAGDAVTALPPFVARFLAGRTPAWRHGTVVVISDLDRLSPRSPVALREVLRQRLGYVFQAWSHQVTLAIDGVAVTPIDPLFLTPGALGYDLDADRAQAGPVRQIALEDGLVTVRTAVLPPAFGAFDKARDAAGRNANGRQALIRDTQGLVISRLGRRVDLLPETPLIAFSQGDRSLKVEIDFEPTLDDLFAPELSLQKVHVAGAVWSALRAADVHRDLEALRRVIRQHRSFRRATPPPKPSARRRPGGAIAAVKESSHV